MPVPFPTPPKEAAYVGQSTTFFPIKSLGEDKCNWCDEQKQLTRFDANDGILVDICKDCERTARMLSAGGFSLRRSYVPKIQELRLKQVGRSKTGTTKQQDT